MTRNHSTRPRRGRVRVDDRQDAVRRLHRCCRCARPAFRPEGSEPLTPGPRSLARARCRLLQSHQHRLLPVAASAASESRRAPQARGSRALRARRRDERSKAAPMTTLVVGHFGRAHPGQFCLAAQGRGEASLPAPDLLAGGARGVPRRGAGGERGRGTPAAAPGCRASGGALAPGAVRSARSGRWRELRAELSGEVSRGPIGEADEAASRPAPVRDARWRREGAWR